MENFFADVQKDGTQLEDLLTNNETETHSESQPEQTKDEEKAEPQEGDNTPQETPFHKHPRWIERENELKELREAKEQQARELAELKSFKEEISTKVNPSGTIPDWFRELYGDNATAYQKYSEHEQKMEAERERRVVARLEQDRQRAASETARWNKWVEDNINSLQSEGKEFDRNELIKTMLDFRPMDEQGNFDFKKGYEIYQLAKTKDTTAKSTARKQLADTSVTHSKEKKQKDYMTAADLRYKSWNSID